MPRPRGTTGLAPRRDEPSTKNKNSRWLIRLRLTAHRATVADILLQLKESQLLSALGASRADNKCSQALKRCVQSLIVASSLPNTLFISLDGLRVRASIAMISLPLSASTAHLCVDAKISCSFKCASPGFNNANSFCNERCLRPQNDS